MQRCTIRTRNSVSEAGSNERVEDSDELQRLAEAGVVGQQPAALSDGSEEPSNALELVRLEHLCKTTASIMAQQPSSVKRSQAQEAGGSDARVGAMAGGQLEPRPSEPTAGRRAEVTRHAAEALASRHRRQRCGGGHTFDSAGEMRAWRAPASSRRAPTSSPPSPSRDGCPEPSPCAPRGEALAEAMGGEHKPMGGRGLLSGALVGLLEGAGALAAAPATATAASGERLSIAACRSSALLLAALVPCGRGDALQRAQTRCLLVRVVAVRCVRYVL